jgi:hypothetical protein
MKGHHSSLVIELKIRAGPHWASPALRTSPPSPGPTAHVAAGHMPMTVPPPARPELHVMVIIVVATLDHTVRDGPPSRCSPGRDIIAERDTTLTARDQVRLCGGRAVLEVLNLNPWW